MISGGTISFTKKFLKASQRMRRAFPEPQPFTAPNFPSNLTPPYKPVPHTHPCSHKPPSFRGQSLQEERQAETPQVLSARSLFRSLPVNQKAARNGASYRKKNKINLSLLIHPREIQEQEQDHSTTHSTDIYRCLCTDSFPDTLSH